MGMATYDYGYTDDTHTLTVRLRTTNDCGTTPTGWTIETNYPGRGCCFTSSRSIGWTESTGPNDTEEKIRWRKYYAAFIGGRTTHFGVRWSKRRYRTKVVLRMPALTATRKRPITQLQRQCRTAIKRALQPRKEHRSI